MNVWMELTVKISLSSPVQSKFTSLSLAFKTDKLTIEQRASVQERARDLSEKNVDRELQGIKDAVEVCILYRELTTRKIAI